jgi:hypothetical protein
MSNGDLQYQYQCICGVLSVHSCDEWVARYGEMCVICDVGVSRAVEICQLPNTPQEANCPDPISTKPAV